MDIRNLRVGIVQSRGEDYESKIGCFMVGIYMISSVNADVKALVWAQKPEAVTGITRGAGV